jgi:anti-sigma regulatory factor (Ser/Thr protein kinase)
MISTVRDSAMTDTDLMGVLRLPVVPESVHLVREFVGIVLDGWGIGAIEDAQLCVSELASNVYSHVGGTALLVQVRRRPAERRIRVEVHDRSAEPPRIRSDTVVRDSGNGLFLVDALSADWGYRLTGDDGKVVWFDVA